MATTIQTLLDFINNTLVPSVDAQAAASAAKNAADAAVISALATQNQATADQASAQAAVSANVNQVKQLVEFFADENPDT